MAPRRLLAPSVLVLLLAVAPAPLWAQPPRTPAVVAPEGALAVRLEELCVTLEKRRQDHHIPGMALAIIQDDKLILARGFGQRDVDKNLPASPDTLFAIGSSTKAFTSLLCAMMVEEGKMGWEEPVTTYLPGFALKDEAATRQATLRDLLGHRTGLGRTDMLWAGGTATREQILAQISHATLKDPFRSKFNYNNVMFLAAGTAAGNVAGSDWDTLVRTRILEPLEMKSTTTSIDAMLPDPRASKGYAWDDEKKSYKHLPMRNLAGIAPAGAINSNVLDMSRWVRLQLGRGTFNGKKLTFPETLMSTWDRQIDMAPQIGYAMGWMLHDWNGKRVVEHGGNIDGFAAEVAMLPDEHVGLVLLANVSATALQGEIQPMVWEALFPPDAPAAGAVPVAELKEYLGKYRFELLGADCTALIRDGKLCLDVPGQTVYELRWPDAEGRWAFALTDTIKLRFDRDDKKNVVSLTLFQAGAEYRMPKEGAHAAGEKPPMTMEALAAYTGTFAFEPRKEEWPVLVKDGRLVVDIPKQRPCVLEWPDQQGRWVFRIRRDLCVQFGKDEAGKVESMTLFERGQTFVMPRIAGTEAPPLPNLDDLMKKRQTVGGGAAVAALGNVRMTGKVDFVHQGIEGTITLLFSGTDRFFQEMDMGLFGFIRSSSDGQSVWSESVGEEFTVLDGKRRDEAVQQAIVSTWADLRPQFDHAEVVGAEPVDGQATAVVRVATKDGSARSTMYLSMEHGLPLKVDATITIPGIGGLPIHIVYSDYRDIGAVRLPFKTTVETDFNGTTIITYDTVETGVTVAPDAYTLRPRAKK